MKMIIKISLILLSFSLFSQEIEMPPLRSTDELLESSLKSRFDFSDAITEIRNSSMERRSIEVNLKYLMILPKLKEIEIFHQFPDFGESPTAELGDYLTGSLAIRAHLDDLTIDQINELVNWSLSETLTHFVDMQPQYIGKKDTTSEVWQSRYAKSLAILQVLKNSDKTNTKAIGSLITLPGFLLGQYFIHQSQSVDINIFLNLLKVLPTGEALDTLLQTIMQQWPLINENKIKIDFLNLTLAIAQKSLEIAPDYLPKPSLGEVFSFQIQDLLLTSSPLNNNIIDNCSKYFSIKDWEDLIGKIMSIHPKEISWEQIPFFKNIYDKILTEKINLLVKIEALKLTSFKRQLQVLEVSHKQIKEGLYQVKISNRLYKLWLIHLNPWQTSATLLTEQGDKMASYDLAEYNNQTNELILTTKSETSTSKNQFKIYLNPKDKNELKIFSGKMITDLDQQSLQLELLSELNNTPLTRQPISNGAYHLNLDGKNFSIELIQSDKHQWSAILNITKNQIQASPIYLETVTACYSNSESCAFVPENTNDDVFIFARIVSISESEISLSLIRGLKVLNLKLKR